MLMMHLKTPFIKCFLQQNVVAKNIILLKESSSTFPL